MGTYKQQDAEEFWSSFMNALAKLPKLTQQIPGSTLVDQLFSGEMLDTYERCDDPTEKQVKSSTFRKLGLNIDKEVNHLNESFELVRLPPLQGKGFVTDDLGSV